MAPEVVYNTVAIEIRRVRKRARAQRGERGHDRRRGATAAFAAESARQCGIGTEQRGKLVVIVIGVIDSVVVVVEINAAAVTETRGELRIAAMQKITNKAT